MPTQVELLLEAERRGILPKEKAALLAEAKKRGLVGPKPGDLKASNPAEYDSTSPEYQEKYGPGARTRDPLGQQLSSRIGAATGGLARGVNLLAGLPWDTAENLVNLGLTGAGAVSNLVTGRKDSPTVMRGSLGTSEFLNDLLRRSGGSPDNTDPSDPANRALYTAGTIAGSSIAPGSTIKNTVPAILGGTVSGEAFGDQWTGIGAMAPATASAGMGALRAKSAANAAQGAKIFTDVGAQPSAGLATGSSFYNGLENLISKFPGGAKVMETFKTKLQADIGKRATTGISTERAGNVIERGVKGPGGFLERTAAEWKRLDQAVSSKLSGKAIISPVNTNQTLQDLTTPVVGAERSTGGLVNPKLKTMLDDINADLAANPQGLPYEALRRIRTKVGGMLDDAMTSDVPKGELKRLYGALSQDMEVAAVRAGAGKEFSRQNKYWSARQSRIEDVLERVIGKGKQPEDIFKAIDPKDPDASGKLTATLRSLEPVERKLVADAVVNKLGRERPSGQNAAGDVFSTDIFLTNWNKISPKAKSMLFPDAKYRSNLDKIARAAETLKHGESAFEQTSGAVGSFAAAGVYAAPFFSIVKMDPSYAIAAGTTAAGAFGGAKLMTNPRFVAWLASGPKGPPQAVANHFARLGALYNGSDDEEFKAELEEYIQRANQ